MSHRRTDLLELQLKAVKVVMYVQAAMKPRRERQVLTRKERLVTILSITSCRI